MQDRTLVLFLQLINKEIGGTKRKEDIVNYLSNHYFAYSLKAVCDYLRICKVPVLNLSVDRDMLAEIPCPALLHLKNENKLFTLLNVGRNSILVSDTDRVGRTISFDQLNNIDKYDVVIVNTTFFKEQKSSLIKRRYVWAPLFLFICLIGIHIGLHDIWRLMIIVFSALGCLGSLLIEYETVLVQFGERSVCSEHVKYDCSLAHDNGHNRLFGLIKYVDVSLFYYVLTILIFITNTPLIFVWKYFTLIGASVLIYTFYYQVVRSKICLYCVGVALGYLLTLLLLLMNF